MAEELVSGVLEQLGSITSQQIQSMVTLVPDVDEEIERLTSNFLFIKAVLEDAENQRVTQTAVTDWLDMLQDTAYDIEDVLDEWSTAIRKLQMEKDGKASMIKMKVCCLIPSNCFCPRQVVHIANKIKKLDKKLDNIVREKSRWNFSSMNVTTEPVQRRITTSFFSDEHKVYGRHDEKKEIIKFLLNESSQGPTLPVQGLITTSSFSDEHKVYGTDNEKKEIINFLLSESSQGPTLPIISIVGMAGLGKTTLARLVYNDDEVKTYFNIKIWVCVSHPFDELRVAKEILQSLKEYAKDEKDKDAKEIVGLQNVLESIHKSIKGKKLLLVLDDVWTDSSEKWQQLKGSLESVSQGSRILMTTRKERTSIVMRTTKTISLEKLSEEKCWSLFSQIAFFGRTNEERENLENIGKKIVHKCNGLPLAVKTIGSHLIMKTKEQWQSVLDNEIWTLEDIEKGIFPPLMLSYYDLPSKLRKCFSYCAIFLKDHMIERDTLVKLWMAQGYLAINTNKDMEVIGEEYFENLAMRSFFQDFEKSEYTGSIIRCKMHDIVHDFAQFLTKNECLIIEDTSHANPQIHPSYQNVRHLMIMKAMNGFPIHTPKKLRSLLIDEVKDLSQLVKELTCLRILLFMSSKIEEVPKGIKNLLHLRYLKLGEYAYIRELPEIVCGLYNLQTLDLTNCSFIEKLPQEIGKLVNLRHLLIDGTNSLKYMPKGLERLTGLKPLSKFVIAGSDQGNKAFTSLEFLKSWNYHYGYFDLRGLGNVRDISAIKVADFKSKENLFDLTLSFDCEETEMRSMIEEDEVILDELQPPPKLVKLLIQDYRGKTMSFRWMGSLTNLRELKFQNFSNLEYLPPLGKLPSLESLEFYVMGSIKRVNHEFLGIKNDTRSPSSITSFPKLKSLELWGVYKWEEWNSKKKGHGGEDITIMPSLYSLSICYSPQLKALRDYLLQSTALEKLEIRRCYILTSNKMGIFSHTSKIVFPNLRELTIWGGEYEEVMGNRCLPSLGRLPSLESLNISNFQGINRVGNEILGIESGGTSTSSIVVFPKLTTLEFYDMGDWEEWDITKKRGEDVIIMPYLHSLSIKWCAKLKALPYHILRKQTLRKLAISGCPILQNIYKEGEEERSKISRIPEIKIPSYFPPAINESKSESFTSSVVTHYK